MIDAFSRDLMQKVKSSMLYSDSDAEGILVTWEIHTSSVDQHVSPCHIHIRTGLWRESAKQKCIQQQL